MFPLNLKCWEELSRPNETSVFHNLKFGWLFEKSSEILVRGFFYAILWNNFCFTYCTRSKTDNGFNNVILI